MLGGAGADRFGIWGCGAPSRWVNGLATTMKTVACPACGRDVRVSEDFAGGRGECPLCGARFEVPVAEFEGDEAPRRPWWGVPRLEWPLGGPRLRRCLACQRNRFAIPGRCARCGGETAGLHPEAVASGDEADLALAAEAFRRRGRWLNWCVGAIWALAAVLVVLLLVETMGQRVFLVNLAFFALFAAPVVAGALWLQQWAAGWIGERFARRYAADSDDEDEDEDHDPAEADSEAEVLAAAVERAREGIVEPFLDRHGVVEGTALRVPEGELGMLRSLLGREGLDLPGDDLAAFLTSCALRRDFDRFRWDLEGQPGVDRGPLVAFVSLAPEGSADEGRLPYLQEVLAEAGRDSSEAHVRELLRDVRRERALRSFAADLQGSRPSAATVSSPSLAFGLAGTGVGSGVTIARVDAMAPREFGPLLSRVHAARGEAVEEAPRAGALGVDVLVGLPENRRVIQGHLSDMPLGPSAVQRAVAARHYYRCRRAVVVTNHHFAPEATALAATEGVELVERRGLVSLLDEFNRSPGRDDPGLAELLAPDPSRAV